jgi:hypothetical protein
VQATSILGVGLAVAALVGGCNGEGEGGATTAPTTTPTTTSSVPAITPAPTTTVDPLAAEEAAVREAAEQARLARSNALIHFDDPAALAALQQYYVADGPALEEVNESIEVLRTEGWRARAHPTIPEGLVVEAITFTDGPPPTRAEVVVCIVDPGIIYEPGGGPDGSDAIVNDQVVAARTTYEMVKVDGTWKLRSLIGGEEFEGLTECPVV